MIDIKDKHECVGCRACEQVCPKSCITMSHDTEGFLYPHVNAEDCVNCNLCEKVCPVLTTGDKHIPLSVIGAKSKNAEIQYKGSSGGIFRLLATQTLNSGGIVFAARFNDDFEVIHDSTDNLNEIDSFCRSKYVQSDTLDTFSRVKEAVLKGLPTMYCGTPCQIKGLRNFLRKDYENLLLVDFICHGVPSPLVWKSYLTAICKGHQPSEAISSVNFRSKKNGGWGKFSLEFNFKESSGLKNFWNYPGQNPYYQLFSQNLSLRPSCYKCPAKGHTSGSDITLADFWGVADDYFDGNGVSLLFLNTEKGKKIVEKIEISSFPTSYEIAIKSNPSMNHSVKEPAKRAQFFAVDGKFTMKHLRKCSGTDTYGRLRRTIIELILKLRR